MIPRSSHETLERISEDRCALSLQIVWIHLWNTLVGWTLFTKIVIYETILTATAEKKIVRVHIFCFKLTETIVFSGTLRELYFLGNIFVCSSYDQYFLNFLFLISNFKWFETLLFLDELWLKFIEFCLSFSRDQHNFIGLSVFSNLWRFK